MVPSNKAYSWFGALFIGAYFAVLSVARWDGLIDNEIPYHESLWVASSRLEGFTAYLGNDVWSAHPPYVMSGVITVAAHIVRLVEVDGGPEWFLLAGRLVNAHIYVAAALLFYGFSLNVVRIARIPKPLSHHVICIICVLATICTFSVPITLAHFCRFTPESLSYLCSVGLFFSVCRLLPLHSPRSSSALNPLWTALAATSGVFLVWSHAYGIWLIAGVLIGYTLTIVRFLSYDYGRGVVGNANFRLFVATIGVLLIALLSVVADWGRFALAQSYLVNHYWSQPVSSYVFGVVPMSFMFYEIVGVRRLPTTVWDVCQATFMAATTYAVVSRRSTSGLTFLASTYLGLVGMASAMHYMWGENFLVAQYLGALFILQMCICVGMLTLVSWVRFAAPLILGACVTFLVVPVVADLYLKGFSQSHTLRHAAKHIDGASAGIDEVIFVGSRTFILLMPYLGCDVVEKSYVYLRAGAYPDNFEGIALIPMRQRVDAGALEEVLSRRFLVIQLQYAQTVRIDLSDHEFVDGTVFAHPSISTGTIFVGEYVTRDT